MANNKQVYWFNLRHGAEQHSYIELDQISRNRWKVTINESELIVSNPSTDPLEVLNDALTLHRRQTP